MTADPTSTPDVSWVPAGGGYQLGLQGGRLLARSPRGAVLKSVPSALRDSDAAEQLRQLREWLERHEAECVRVVETWMVRSLPVPSPLLAAVWPDPAWGTALRNAVIWPVGDGGPDRDSAGFLRETRPGGTLGVVDLDGETSWIAPPVVGIPHPILLPRLQEFRDFASELDLEQGVLQLHRETWVKDGATDETDQADEKSEVSAFAGGYFVLVAQALTRCRNLGYAVNAGSAVCRTWEDGRLVEARYWVGIEAPDSSTSTGDLVWVDADGSRLTLADVGPVAYSEGMRMAAGIFAGRSIGGEEE